MLSLNQTFEDLRAIKVLVVPVGNNSLFDAHFQVVSRLRTVPFYELNTPTAPEHRNSSVGDGAAPSSSTSSSGGLGNNSGNNALKYFSWNQKGGIVFDYLRYDRVLNGPGELDNFQSSKRVLMIMGLINYPELGDTIHRIDEELDYFSRRHPYIVLRRLFVFNFAFDDPRAPPPPAALRDDLNSLVVFPPEGFCEGGNSRMVDVHLDEVMSHAAVKIILSLQRQLKMCEELRTRNQQKINAANSLLGNLSQSISNSGMSGIAGASGGTEAGGSDWLPPGLPLNSMYDEILDETTLELKRGTGTGASTSSSASYAVSSTGAAASVGSSAANHYDPGGAGDRGIGYFHSTYGGGGGSPSAVSFTGTAPSTATGASAAGVSPATSTAYGYGYTGAYSGEHAGSPAAGGSGTGVSGSSANNGYDRTTNRSRSSTSTTCVTTAPAVGGSSSGVMSGGTTEGVSAAPVTGSSSALSRVPIGRGQLKRFLFRTNKRPTHQQHTGRIRKWMGDLCLQVSSPVDAIEHYQLAVTELKTHGDSLWLASALDGYAASIILLISMRSDFSVDAVLGKEMKLLSSYMMAMHAANNVDASASSRHHATSGGGGAGVNVGVSSSSVGSSGGNNSGGNSYGAGPGNGGSNSAAGGGIGDDLGASNENGYALQCAERYSQHISSSATENSVDSKDLGNSSSTGEGFSKGDAVEAFAYVLAEAKGNESIAIYARNIVLYALEVECTLRLARLHESIILSNSAAAGDEEADAKSYAADVRVSFRGRDQSFIPSSFSAGQGSAGADSHNSRKGGRRGTAAGSGSAFYQDFDRLAKILSYITHAASVPGLNTQQQIECILEGALICYRLKLRRKHAFFLYLAALMSAENDNYAVAHALMSYACREFGIQASRRLTASTPLQLTTSNEFPSTAALLLSPSSSTLTTSRPAQQEEVQREESRGSLERGVGNGVGGTNFGGIHPESSSAGVRGEDRRQEDGRGDWDDEEDVCVLREESCWNKMRFHLLSNATLVAKEHGDVTSSARFLAGLLRLMSVHQEQQLRVVDHWMKFGAFVRARYPLLWLELKMKLESDAAAAAAAAANGAALSSSSRMLQQIHSFNNTNNNNSNTRFLSTTPTEFELSLALLGISTATATAGGIGGGICNGNDVGSVAFGGEHGVLGGSTSPARFSAAGSALLGAAAGSSARGEAIMAPDALPSSARSGNAADSSSSRRDGNGSSEHSMGKQNAGFGIDSISAHDRVDNNAASRLLGSSPSTQLVSGGKNVGGGVGGGGSEHNDSSEHCNNMNSSHSSTIRANDTAGVGASESQHGIFASSPSSNGGGSGSSAAAAAGTGLVSNSTVIFRGGAGSSAASSTYHRGSLQVPKLPHPLRALFNDGHRVSAASSSSSSAAVAASLSLSLSATAAAVAASSSSEAFTATIAAAVGGGSGGGATEFSEFVGASSDRGSMTMAYSSGSNRMMAAAASIPSNSRKSSLGLAAGGADWNTTTSRRLSVLEGFSPVGGAGTDAKRSSMYQNEDLLRMSIASSVHSQPHIFSSDAEFYSIGSIFGGISSEDCRWWSQRMWATLNAIRGTQSSPFQLRALLPPSLPMPMSPSVSFSANASNPRSSQIIHPAIQFEAMRMFRDACMQLQIASPQLMHRLPFLNQSSRVQMSDGLSIGGLPMKDSRRFRASSTAVRIVLPVTLISLRPLPVSIPQYSTEHSRAFPPMGHIRNIQSNIRFRTTFQPLADCDTLNETRKTIDSFRKATLSSAGHGKQLTGTTSSTAISVAATTATPALFYDPFAASREKKRLADAHTESVLWPSDFCHGIAGSRSIRSSTSSGENGGSGALGERGWHNQRGGVSLQSQQASCFLVAVFDNPLSVPLTLDQVTPVIRLRIAHGRCPRVQGPRFSPTAPQSTPPVGESADSAAPCNATSVGIDKEKSGRVMGRWSRTRERNEKNGGGAGYKDGSLLKLLPMKIQIPALARRFAVKIAICPLAAHSSKISTGATTNTVGSGAEWRSDACNTLLEDGSLLVEGLSMTVGNACLFVKIDRNGCAENSKKQQPLAIGAGAAAAATAGKGPRNARSAGGDARSSSAAKQNQSPVTGSGMVDTCEATGKACNEIKLFDAFPHTIASSHFLPILAGKATYLSNKAVNDGKFPSMTDTAPVGMNIPDSKNRQTADKQMANRDWWSSSTERLQLLPGELRREVIHLSSNAAADAAFQNSNHGSGSLRSQIGTISSSFSDFRVTIREISRRKLSRMNDVDSGDSGNPEGADQRSDEEEEPETSTEIAHRIIDFQGCMRSRAVGTATDTRSGSTTATCVAIPIPTGHFSSSSCSSSLSSSSSAIAALGRSPLGPTERHYRVVPRPSALLATTAPVVGTENRAFSTTAISSSVSSSSAAGAATIVSSATAKQGTCCRIVSFTLHGCPGEKKDRGSSPGELNHHVASAEPSSQSPFSNRVPATASEGSTVFPSFSALSLELEFQAPPCAANIDDYEDRDRDPIVPAPNAQESVKRSAARESRVEEIIRDIEVEVEFLRVGAPEIGSPSPSPMNDYENAAVTRSQSKLRLVDSCRRFSALMKDSFSSPSSSSSSSSSASLTAVASVTATMAADASAVDAAAAKDTANTVCALSAVEIQTGQDGLINSSTCGGARDENNAIDREMVARNALLDALSDLGDDIYAAPANACTPALPSAATAASAFVLDLYTMKVSVKYSGVLQTRAGFSDLHASQAAGSGRVWSEMEMCGSVGISQIRNLSPACVVQVDRGTPVPSKWGAGESVPGMDETYSGGRSGGAQHGAHPRPISRSTLLESAGIELQAGACAVSVAATAGANQRRGILSPADGSTRIRSIVADTLCEYKIFNSLSWDIWVSTSLALAVHSTAVEHNQRSTRFPPSSVHGGLGDAILNLESSSGLLTVIPARSARNIVVRHQGPALAPPFLAFELWWAGIDPTGDAYGSIATTAESSPFGGSSALRDAHSMTYSGSQRQNLCLISSPLWHFTRCGLLLSAGQGALRRVGVEIEAGTGGPGILSARGGGAAGPDRDRGDRKDRTAPALLDIKCSILKDGIEECWSALPPPSPPLLSELAVGTSVCADGSATSHTTATKNKGGKNAHRSETQATVLSIASTVSIQADITLRIPIMDTFPSLESRAGKEGKGLSALGAGFEGGGGVLEVAVFIARCDISSAEEEASCRLSPHPSCLKSADSGAGAVRSVMHNGWDDAEYDAGWEGYSSSLLPPKNALDSGDTAASASAAAVYDRDLDGGMEIEFVACGKPVARYEIPDYLCRPRSSAAASEATGTSSGRDAGGKALDKDTFLEEGEWTVRHSVDYSFLRAGTFAVCVLAKVTPVPGSSLPSEEDLNLTMHQRGTSEQNNGTGSWLVKKQLSYIVVRDWMDDDFE